MSPSLTPHITTIPLPGVGIVTQDNKPPKHDQTHTAQDKQRRVLVLCFDGTGNKFGQNSNIVRFFRALDKRHFGQQIVYYQPGIGTYNKRAFITHTVSTLASTLDQAFARGLNDHVKEGYQFIIQNYRPGDKICLFGFSRGAHTARVVAGMVYKVGILPKENIQQVDFAFNIYGTTGHQGFKLSHEFKTTFTPIAEPPASVDFVGVWDTVSSIGLIPRTHPYTSANYAVKTFRHALALDERRVRFRPNVWSEITLDREQELDVDIPIPQAGDSIPQPKRNQKRDDWGYRPPDRDYTDVKEVWFAGTHADVGGGSHSSSYPSSLSSIPLRWMIKECILCETGILFDLKYLRDWLEFDFDELQKEAEGKGIKLGEQYPDLERYAEECANRKKLRPKQIHSSESTQEDTAPTKRLARHVSDVGARIYDQLIMFWWFWWILELIPMLFVHQDRKGNWVRRRRRNLGRGRYIPVDENGKVLIHVSVKERMRQAQKENLVDAVYAKMAYFLDYVINRMVGGGGILEDESKYKPKAFNWGDLERNENLEYVQ